MNSMRSIKDYNEVRVTEKKHCSISSVCFTLTDFPVGFASLQMIMS